MYNKLNELMEKYKGTRWQHQNGNIYEIYDFNFDSNSVEIRVTYENVKEPGLRWSRLWLEFQSERQGKPRFTQL